MAETREEGRSAERLEGQGSPGFREQMGLEREPGGRVGGRRGSVWTKAERRKVGPGRFQVSDLGGWSPWEAVPARDPQEEPRGRRRRPCGAFGLRFLWGPKDRHL